LQRSLQWEKYPELILTDQHFKHFLFMSQDAIQLGFFLIERYRARKHHLVLFQSSAYTRNAGHHPDFLMCMVNSRSYAYPHAWKPIIPLQAWSNCDVALPLSSSASSWILSHNFEDAKLPNRYRLMKIPKREHSSLCELESIFSCVPDIVLWYQSLSWRYVEEKVSGDGVFLFDGVRVEG
jgi:hypothetical protein